MPKWDEHPAVLKPQVSGSKSHLPNALQNGQRHSHSQSIICERRSGTTIDVLDLIGTWLFPAHTSHPSQGENYPSVAG